MTDEQIAKLSAYTDQLLNGLIGLRQAYAFLRPMIFDTEVQKAHGSGHKGYGFKTIRHRLYYACLQDVVNLAFDRDRRTPSICNVLTRFSSPQVRAHLRAKYAESRFPVEPDEDPATRQAREWFQAQDEADRRASFDEKCESIDSQWHRLQNEVWVPRFKDARNKLTAHLEMRKTDNGYRTIEPVELGLQWRDLEDALAAIEPLVLDLNVVIRNAGYAIDMLGEQLERAKTAFWGRPMGGET